ncbi:excinuclease ABC subunit UvrC [Candidatus Gracilibacteria bacterium]|nr:excinuclease ABC subunit UvrC [Candidatus Gracilibacteria bacterium]NUJ99152.1 excinuclease ABC subunit UvrC [Candidatus Gracilibacteria bacterium]
MGNTKNNISKSKKTHISSLLESDILKNIPKSPGVYIFYNEEKKILYIGKSIHLKSRVNSYFNDKNKLNFAKKKMVSEIKNIETIITNNETESLILESTLIKKHLPKYNILMKDDKNYLYIKITKEIIPKIFTTRIKNYDGEYFGPYTSSNNVKNTLKVLKKIFGYRACNLIFGKEDKNLIIQSTNGVKIPCMDYYIKRCAGPCLLNKENIQAYKESIEKIKKILNGETKEIIKILEEEMYKKASELKFEEASELKKDKESLVSLETLQTVRDFVKGDYDVINFIKKYERFFVGCIEIRDNKITEVKNYEIENYLEESDEEILEKFLLLKEYSSSGLNILNFLLPITLENHNILEESLAKIITIKQVKIETPKVGPKFEMLKFAYKNVYEFAYKKYLASQSTKNFTAKTQKNFLTLLGYTPINKDIIFECNDISHLSGTHTVASRSIIKNGKTDSSLYKKFTIKTLENNKIDDFSALKEIIQRRLKEIENKKNLPDLIIIDGGKGQLSAVLTTIEAYKKNCDEPTKILLDKLQLISLAKKEEEIFLPGKSEAILLDKESEELRLIQKIRDEAHRFAITFNREKRIQSMQKNILESLPGFGAITRKKLLKKYGSVENLKNIPKEELKEILNKTQIETLEDHLLI